MDKKALLDKLTFDELVLLRYETTKEDIGDKIVARTLNGVWVFIFISGAIRTARVNAIVTNQDYFFVKKVLSGDSYLQDCLLAFYYLTKESMNKAIQDDIAKKLLENENDIDLLLQYKSELLESKRKCT